jgi:hypothetical protein
MLENADIDCDKVFVDTTNNKLPIWRALYTVHTSEDWKAHYRSLRAKEMLEGT